LHRLFYLYLRQNGYRTQPMFSFIYLYLLFKDVAKASVDKLKDYYKDEQNIL
jgi:hypothetical protein